MKLIIGPVFLFMIVLQSATAQKAILKPRVFVLTDVHEEPDDTQSLVRLMTYSNQLDIEGLVATTSCWYKDQVNPSYIHDVVNAYAKVRDNLEIHETGFPTHESIKSHIKKGIPKFGMEGVGFNRDSEGSEWLIKALTNDDERPLYVLGWGGTNILAQALWKLQRTKTQAELDGIIRKIRVYAIADQDDSGPWLRTTFPNLFYIVSPGYKENGGGYHFSTWVGISGDKVHGRFSGPDFTLVDNPWLVKNIKENHGPLGAVYPLSKNLMEGDSPTFLGLVTNGLNNPYFPNYGGWGGRYEHYIPVFKKYFYQEETRPFWTDAIDEVYSATTKQYHTSNQATIWRWREAYQNDFAARIDWSNTRIYKNANHPPKAKLGHENEITIRSGELVNLSAEGSSDPDNDKLTYHWIYYKEVGSYSSIQELKLKNKDSKTAHFIAPQVEKSETAHFIVEIIDDGIPNLTRYQRVIVNILP